MRVLYGLDAVPREMLLDDARLPSWALGPAPLRLNTQPVPRAVLADAGDGHAGRRAALTRWLLAQAGDWAADRRRMVLDYLAFVADELRSAEAEIADALLRYDGLYRPEDWFWSALRPLPRAWIVSGKTRISADLAFWDGHRVYAAGLRGAPPAGVQPFARGAWPDALRGFWRAPGLPCSPFRWSVP